MSRGRTAARSCLRSLATKCLSDRQFRETMPVLHSFYNQWRRARSFPFQHSQAGEFERHLLAGRVQEFDLTQDCNMASEYTRCFYRLKGAETVHQETPCTAPAIRWKTVDNALQRCYAEADRTTRGRTLTPTTRASTARSKFAVCVAARLWLVEKPHIREN